MGHTGHLKGEYLELLKRLGKGQVALPEPADEDAREGWKDILEILYTPEEAKIASRMPIMPSGLRKTAARVGMDPDELKPILDKMADKGLVMDLVHPKTKKTAYLMSPPVVGFIEFSLMRMNDKLLPQKRLADAMSAYMNGDRAFAEEVFGTDTVVGRALAQEEHMEDDPLPEVLDWERAKKIIEEAWCIALSHCYCRHKAMHLGHECDVPTELCLSLNTAADFVVRRDFGRKIDVAEALGVLETAKKHGLVQIADNAQDRPIYICNCCACCCQQLHAINSFDMAAVNPSGFEPHFNEEMCRGCSKCARACPITSITMEPKRVVGQIKSEMQPILNADRCIGCGVCANACKKGVITMVRRDKMPVVPKNTIERTLRMSIEKGRLADMIFDGGSTQGRRFLSRTLRALANLPPTKQVLANEQLQSRFIKFFIESTRAKKSGA
ncbi:MAG: 4Fe-4S binding protein [Proteobacteria bacterium]|nr:4Fe-4S binding protein [Pseudomonadota bacterium]